MRGYRHTNYKPNISTQEKFFSGLTCLTYGLTGFLWLIVSHIRKQSLSPFARFHIFQSILVFFALYIIGLILNIFLGFLQIMPFIGPIFVNIAYFIKGYPLIFGLSAAQLLIEGIAAYMAVFALWGKYAEVPGISDTVRKII